MTRTKKLIAAGTAAVAVLAGALTLSATGTADATPTTPQVSTTVSRHGYQYGCEIPVKGVSVPLLDIHGTYTAAKSKCGTSHQIDEIWMGALPAAPVTSYGIAQVFVSRGGATPTAWATYSTTLGSPVGDTASGAFRFTCSVAKAPCQVSVKAYATTTGVKVYPRLLITKEDINTAAPDGTCEYADGVDNETADNGYSAALGTSAATVDLGIGGTLDCGAGQTYPTGTDGAVDEITTPAGYFNVAATFTFKQ